ncbi:MAG TPA: glycosyltransferase family 87 protein, partial [Acetobacteraceae bacterium]|nr:glycosyltransferase family 87 protein [Acetobacteraceae bacterium]
MRQQGNAIPIGSWGQIPATARPRAWSRNLVAVCIGLFAGAYATALACVSFRFSVDSDFFCFWNLSRFVAESPPARIYDHAATEAFLLSLDPPHLTPFPFPYPPIYLLLIRPLSWLTFPVAQILWSGITFLAYVAALWNRRAPSQAALFALLAPTTAINFLFGQNGFLTAALLIGGTRLAPSRPVIGGTLLGLLCYKPQFIVLIAIALASARLWRAALVAVSTIGLLTLSSLIVFGITPWIAWISSLPEFGQIVLSQSERLFHLMPTLFPNALTLGLRMPAAGAVQVIGTCLAAAGVWFAFRRSSPASCAPALAVASVLATPYAFIYDLTLVTAAVILFRAQYFATLSAYENLVMSAAALLPIGMLFNLVGPVPPIVLGFVCVMISIRLCRVTITPVHTTYLRTSIYDEEIH